FFHLMSQLPFSPSHCKKRILGRVPSLIGVTRLSYLLLLCLFLSFSGCLPLQADAVEVTPTSPPEIIPSPTGAEEKFTVDEVVATLTASAPLPSVTPRPTKTKPPVPTAQATVTPTETPIPTETPSPTETIPPTPTETATPTAEPLVQPVDPTVNSTTVDGFVPLSAQFSVVWRFDPQDSSQAIAEVLIVAFGGSGEYRYFQDGILLNGPLFEYKRPACQTGFSSFRIESTDGQSIELDHYETPPCL
ncbi:MAG: hypothetical protein AAF633_22405, partial [Chloroflexota bacterium]